jgi:hypothetical protein
MMGGWQRRRWAVLALLCVAQFVDVLDVNAVIVALPAPRLSPVARRLVPPLWSRGSGPLST